MHKHDDALGRAEIAAMIGNTIDRLEASLKSQIGDLKKQVAVLENIAKEHHSDSWVKEQFRSNW